MDRDVELVAASMGDGLDLISKTSRAHDLCLVDMTHIKTIEREVDGKGEREIGHLIQGVSLIIVHIHHHSVRHNVGKSRKNGGIDKKHAQARRGGGGGGGEKGERGAVLGGCGHLLCKKSERVRDGDHLPIILSQQTYITPNLAQGHGLPALSLYRITQHRPPVHLKGRTHIPDQRVEAIQIVIPAVIRQ